MMTTDLITILLTFAAVTLTLAGMILSGLRGIRVEMRERFDGLEVRMGRLEARMDKLEARLAGVEQGQAELKGKLEGLLEALVFTRGVA